jgi:3'(2'), 5'-bisphosphate nucleotidase
MLQDHFWNGLASDLEQELGQYRSRISNIDVTVKADKTLLTEADIAIEQMIIDRIRQIDKDPVIVAEEDARTAIRQDVLDRPERVWVIDPIDGTAEFVQPDSTEFCSVVCFLEQGQPTAALVVAPELGPGRASVVVMGSWAEKAIFVNGIRTPERQAASTQKYASVTRSRDDQPRKFEGKLAAAGYDLKTRTTSQTIDMLRTAVDPADLGDPGGQGFDLFYRTQQKIWDGVAGLCLGGIAGLVTVDHNGASRLPVSPQLLSRIEPKLDCTLMGTEEAVSWFLTLI